MDILERIKQAKPEEMDDLLHAVLDRYRELYPDWDISTVSIEKKGDLNEQLDAIIALIERMKDK